MGQWLHNTAPPCTFFGLASRATRTKERDGDPVCRDSSMIAIGPRAKRDVVHGCLIGAQGTCFWARGACFWARGACFWARGASDRAADSRHRAADSRTAPDRRTLIAAARLHDAVDTRNPSAPPALYYCCSVDGFPYDTLRGLPVVGRGVLWRSAGCNTRA